MKKFEIKNAVLYKDMNLDMKNAKTVVIVLIFNIILAAIAMLTISIMTVVGANYVTVSYRVLVWLFIGLVAIESTLICFLVPALTAGCISIEKERQTLEVLLTTKMTPWEIVKGKYMSAISMVILLILSSLPVFSLVFIYGGISLWQLFLVVLVLITSAMYIASFGVFFSAFVKNTIGSVILTYLTVGMVLFFGFGLASMGIGIVEAINESLYYGDITKVEHLLNGDFFILCLLPSPIVTVFDTVGRVFGYTIDGYTIRGMLDFSEILSHFTDKNVFLNLWSVFSVAIQLGITYLMLRLAAFCLNPVKGKKRKKMNKV